MIENNYGYIYVASVKKYFYDFAVNSARSLKDFYPDAKITLFTHEKFLDGREKIFDNVVTNIPIHSRAKMWAMANSPYDRTVYIDVDSEIWHEDISTLFDELDDCDAFFTKTPIYSAGRKSWTQPLADDKLTYLTYQGGFCGFKRSDLIQDFLNTWYTEYLTQREDFETEKFKKFNPDMKPWDMFTLWRITNEDEFARFRDGLNIKLLNVRFNFCTNYHKEELEGKEPVVIHFNKDAIFKDPGLETFRKRVLKKDETNYFTKQEINQNPPKFN